MTLLAGVLLASAAEPLTLEAALGRARERYPAARIAALNQDEAKAKRASATGALFPRLRAEGGVQVWDSAYAIAFVNTNDIPEAQRAFLPESLLAPSRVRDRVTGDAKLTLVQPLTGLYPLLFSRHLESLGVDAREAGRKRTENDLAFRVVETYTQALQAEAGKQIAEKGIELADSLRERAEQLASVGMVGRADVLRAQVSLASAKERALSAKTAVELTREALAMLIVAELKDFSLVSPTLPEDSVALDAALEEARRSRPELREVAKQVEQADAAVHLARSQMVPQLLAMASYQYTFGQAFLPRNQFFFGALLQWDVWEWGNKWYQIDAARAKAEAAHFELEKLEQALLLDLRQAHTRQAIARESVAAAKVALDANREFLAAEEGRYAAGQTTATDLALAQTNYLAAEYNHTQARHAALVARAALDKAMGKRPLAQNKER